MWYSKKPIDPVLQRISEMWLWDHPLLIPPKFANPLIPKPNNGFLANISIPFENISILSIVLKSLVWAPLNWLFVKRFSILSILSFRLDANGKLSIKVKSAITATTTARLSHHLFLPLRKNTMAKIVINRSTKTILLPEEIAAKEKRSVKRKESIFTQRFLLKNKKYRHNIAPKELKIAMSFSSPKRPPKRSKLNDSNSERYFTKYTTKKNTIPKKAEISRGFVIVLLIEQKV